MHKGEVVEEGDHDSLMRARGTYFGLVEQENLSKAEEEEKLAFEQQESAGMVLAHQEDETNLSVMRKRASTVTSLTRSVTATLYGRKRNSVTDEDAEQDEDEEAKKKKVYNES